MTTHEFVRSARGRLVDDLLVLKAKGTVATTMVGEDPVGTDKSYDTGGGRTRGDFAINVYATPNILASTKLTFRLQGGRNSSFSTLTDLAIVELGDSTQISSGSDMTTGRYVVPFSNDFDGTVYRYLRHYLTCGGTCGTGVQYEAYISKLFG
jgi:hypothetical protein